MKHRGSISCNCLCFATLIQLLAISPLSSILTSAKKAKLGELVGDVQEEEPEGEAVVGPSGEATLHSLGSILPVIIFSEFCAKLYK